jgi:fibronectin type 3 domain-containing protein
MRRYLTFLILAGVLVLAMASAQAANKEHHLEWSIEDVDSGRDPDPAGTAIAIAPDGTIHLAYTDTGGKILHGIKDSSGCWTVEWVNQPAGHDTGARVLGFDLVVDGDGSYYLVFHEPKDGSVRIVSDRPGVSGTIADNVTGSPFPSMAVGPDGRIHIVYLDGLLKVPRYASMERDGEWEVASLTERPHNASGRTSITLDDMGRLHVVYSANYGEYIRPPFYGMHYLVMGTDGTWSEVEQDIQSNVYGPFDICAADEFGVFIAYTRKHKDYEDDPLNIRTFIATNRGDDGWVFSLPMSTSYMTYDPSIEITTAGVLHIVGEYPWYGTLGHYRMSPDGKWTKQVFGRVGDNGTSFALALDERADLHVAFANTTGGRIQYAYATGRPGTPRDMEVIPAVGRLVVNWKAPSETGSSNITHYTVYFLADGDDYPEYKTTWSDRCTYINDDVTKGTPYDVWVAAWNDAGQGPGSTRLSVTTISSPSAPTDLNGTEGDEHNVLRWSPPQSVGDSPITGYRIYWNVWYGFGGCNIVNGWMRGSSLTAITLDGPDTLHYDHTGLENGMYHIYYVTALTEEGEGAGTYYMVLIPRRLPSPPVNLSATAYDGSVALDWEPPLDYGDAEILRYIVYRGSSLDEMEEIGHTSYRWSDWNLWSPAPTSYSDEDVVDGKVYYYYITAVNGLGEGPPSDPIMVPAVKTPIAPSQPINLTAEFVDGVVVLSWMAPLNDGGRPVLEYWVYRATSGVVPTVEGVVTSGTNDFNDTILVLGFTYYYSVSAVNEAGEGERSNRTSVFASKPDDPDPPVEPEPEPDPEPPVVPEPEPPVVPDPDPPIEPEPPVVPQPPTDPELPEDPGSEPEGPGDEDPQPSDQSHVSGEEWEWPIILGFVVMAIFLTATIGYFLWSRWD